MESNCAINTEFAMLQMYINNKIIFPNVVLVILMLPKRLHPAGALVWDLREAPVVSGTDSLVPVGFAQHFKALTQLTVSGTLFTSTDQVNFTLTSFIVKVAMAKRIRVRFITERTLV